MHFIRKADSDTQTVNKVRAGINFAARPSSTRLLQADCIATTVRRALTTQTRLGRVADAVASPSFLVIQYVCVPQAKTEGQQTISRTCSKNRGVPGSLA